MKRSIHRLLTMAGIACAALLSSCNIYDDQGDCSVHYRVPFAFTNNILNTDAFGTQVKSVTLYVYDTAGNLVLKKTESGDILGEPGYAMDVDLLPGHYSMLAWCEGEPMNTPATAFEIGGGENPASITELSATLPLMTDPSTSQLYSDKDIVPLFHGYIADVECPDTYGTVMLPTMDLHKDTNIFNVSLENLEGTPIAEDALTVSIVADNSEMDWRNNPIGNKIFSYRPWYITAFSSEREEAEVRAGDDLATNPITGLLAELTTGRLMIDRKPVLVIHRKRDNKDIIRLDLVKYLCMIKGHYQNHYSNQDYLDRMDYYEISFFIDADLNWYMAGGININGWHVVPEQEMEL